ncbi:NUDIX domain-containing protein [Saccharopolyspora shandongensis]|uniref:NUDIX hydrolase n=1 Tax=Saccharopolyspora shandongensis TaxID=418495 RepID=UPI00342B2E4E
MTALPDPADLARQASDDAVDQLAVAAVVDHEGRILVLHRADADGTHTGDWGLPAGTVESAEDLISALRRAVAGETGLDIAEIVRYLGEFDYTSRDGQQVRQHTWSVTVRGPAPIRLREHQDYAWITRRDERPVGREVRALIRQHQHEPPAELPDPWPFAGLVLRSPRLELRPDDDGGLRELPLLGAQGVHLGEEMPMGSPWTDEPPDELCRNTMQSYWRRRAELRPDNWRLSSLIRYRGRVIGTQLLYAQRFATKREVGTGS